MGGLKAKKLKKLKFHRIKTWQLFLLLIPLLFVDATLLRVDHIKMTELRDSVIKADEEENDEKISKALEELKNFTFSNIVINVSESNGIQKIFFGTGQFYLEHQYLRAAAKAIEAAEKELAEQVDNPNGNVYAAASETCKPIAIKNGWSWYSKGYIECMTSEIEKHPAADSLTDQISAKIPSTELYLKNYASPIWAPTASGFCILLTLLVVFILIIRMFIWIFLKIALIFI